MGQKQYEYDGMICEVPDNGGAYVVFPWNIRKEFGKGRVKVHAEFDGLPYDGSIVNMGVKDEDGNVCYVIGLLKSIRKQLNKGDGDRVHVVIWERFAKENHVGKPREHEETALGALPMDPMEMIRDKFSQDCTIETVRHLLMAHFHMVEKEAQAMIDEYFEIVDRIG